MNELQKELNSLFFNLNICCGTQKNRLNETFLLSTQNMLKLWLRKYLQFYTLKFCLSKPEEYHIYPKLFEQLYFLA